MQNTITLPDHIHAFGTPATLQHPCRPSHHRPSSHHLANCITIITSNIATTPQPTHKSHFNNHLPCPIPPVRSITSIHSFSNLSAIASFENSPITLSLALFPISGFTPLVSTISRISDHCSPGRRNPVRLSSMVSRGPP